MGVGIGEGEGLSAECCLLEKLGGTSGLNRKCVCVLLEF